MKQMIAHIALLVKDYDEALDFYIGKLGFELIEDTKLTETKRWVLVRPPGTVGTALLLARAANDVQLTAIGNQSGGRVFLFLYTDHIEQVYKNLLDHSITIIRELNEEPHGKVAVFADLYGNLWDLIQPNQWPDCSVV